jgi:hypothetical protein
MKITCGFPVLATVLFFHSSAQAQCTGGPNVSCVTSFSIGGEPLPGNGSEFATGTIAAHLAQCATTLYLRRDGFGCSSSNSRRLTKS